MPSSSVLSDSLWPHGLKPSGPLSMESPRKEYWSGLPFPSPGDLPNTRKGTLRLCVSCYGRWILLPLCHLESQRLNRFTLKEAGGEGHCLMGKKKKLDPQIREKKSKKRWILEKDLWRKYRACKMKYLGMSGLGEEETKGIFLQIHLLYNMLCIPFRQFQDLR